MQTFIDRHDELDIISHLLIRLNNGEKISHPIREYVGVGGVGKTALLHEIRKLSLSRGLAVSFLDYAEFESLETSKAISLLLSKIVKSILSENPPEDVLEKLQTEDPLSDGTWDQLIQIFQSVFCVVIIDSLNLAPSDLVQLLGEKFIFPLIETGQILVVIGARSRVEWGTPKYRIMRRTRSTALLTFPLEYTAQQVDPLAGVSEDIQRITCGHPEANDIISSILDYTQNLNYLDKHNFGDYEARLVSGIVEEVIRKRAVIPAELFRAFTYLSVFRYVDMDAPIEVLNKIDPARNWNEPLEVIQLIREMQDKTEHVVSPDSSGSGYKINEFVRRSLSLYLRFFHMDDFLEISRVAVAYYERKYYKEFSKIHYLVEKLYHQLDVIKLSIPYLSDLDVALRIRTELRRDLEPAFAGPLYLALSEKSSGLQSIHNLFDRQTTFEKLRLIVKADHELNEKIGDLSSSRETTVSFLLQVVEDCWKEFTSTGIGTLEILKHYKPKDEVDSVPTVDAYEVSFRRSAREIIRISRSFEISPQANNGIQNDVRNAEALNELSQLGLGLMGQLPSDMQKLLQEHTEPLILDVNDTSIPWELLHDGREFLSLRLPLGKQIRTSEIPKLARQNAEALNVLLIGVPKSDIDIELPSLRYVEEEIEQLHTALRDLPGINFDPANDVLFGEEAHVWEVQKRLKMGKYRIIHFAGHAVFDETAQQGGIILHDGVLKTETIKSSVEGKPLVFLNACQSAQGRGGYTSFGDYRGIHASGIASAFVIGGALACVAGIWEVKDKSSSQFSINFYSNLVNGVMIGEALRRTKQNEFHRNPNDRTWANYVLFGDPAQKL